MRAPKERPLSFCEKYRGDSDPVKGRGCTSGEQEPKTGGKQTRIRKKPVAAFDEDKWTINRSL